MHNSRVGRALRTALGKVKVLKKLVAKASKRNDGASMLKAEEALREWEAIAAKLDAQIGG